VVYTAVINSYDSLYAFYCIDDSGSYRMITTAPLYCTQTLDSMLFPPESLISMQPSTLHSHCMLVHFSNSAVIPTFLDNLFIAIVKPYLEER